MPSDLRVSLKHLACRVHRLERRRVACIRSVAPTPSRR